MILCPRSSLVKQIFIVFYAKENIHSNDRKFPIDRRVQSRTAAHLSRLHKWLLVREFLCVLYVSVLFWISTSRTWSRTRTFLRASETWIEIICIHNIFDLENRVIFRYLGCSILTHSRSEIVRKVTFSLYLWKICVVS